MNGSNPPPAFSGAAVLPASPIPSLKSKPEPPVHLPRLLVGLALAVALFDLCFWEVKTCGFGVALFSPLLAGIILGNRASLGERRSTRLLMVLLAGAAFAAAMETGFTNVLVLLILMVVLAGNSFYHDVESPWGRWLSQAIALVFAPGRVFWLGARLMEAAFREGLGWTGGLIGGCLLAMPALVLALLFGSLLASGNAVFGSWTNSFFDWFWKELDFYLDGERIALWFLVAFLVLPLLRPAQISAWWWRWTERLPRLPEIIPARGALFSSGLVLVVLNLLFFLANIADVLFLWSAQALPAGVTYSGFVHHGVNTLIVTVLLSAFVLTAIFQQALDVVRRRELKALALVWVAQNLFLLLSVALRLKLYIEAYDMTVARLSVMIFLALVAIGYALLIIKIARERSLSWLVGGCVLAVFATFYVTQFLDLKGWSANYNVARWELDRSRRLDDSYLLQLGAPAWPALARAHEIEPENFKINNLLKQSRGGAAYSMEAGLKWKYWREFSLRAWLNRWALEKPNN